MSDTVPFKNDIVGSFLRPMELKQAREQYAKEELTTEELTKIEDRCILELMDKQKQNGLSVVTDGEFRRRWWHLDFLEELTGITKISYGDIITFNGVKMKNAEGYVVSGKLSFPPTHPFLKHFTFVNTHAGGSLAKQTIPGPNMIYLAGALLQPMYAQHPVYEQSGELEAAIVETYQTAIQAFYEAGCRYLQFDDTAWGSLLDPEKREELEKTGISVDSLLKQCAEITRKSLAKKPADMAITFHFCRGNFKSSWLYQGTYDAIAQELFSIEEFDGFFLEYDDERSGSFEPLKFLKNQKIVLGLITSKSPQLEDKQDLVERIKEASRYVSLDQICISPQCGFASTEEGNSLTEEEQWAKIRLVNETAALLEKMPKQ